MGDRAVGTNLAAVISSCHASVAVEKTYARMQSGQIRQRDLCFLCHNSLPSNPIDFSGCRHKVHMECMKFKFILDSASDMSLNGRSTIRCGSSDCGSYITVASFVERLRHTTIGGINQITSSEVVTMEKLFSEDDIDSLSSHQTPTDAASSEAMDKELSRSGRILHSSQIHLYRFQRRC